MCDNCSIPRSSTAVSASQVGARLRDSGKRFERDFEFATQFDLPIVRVVAAPDEDADTPLENAYVGPGTLVNSAHFDGTDVSQSVSAVTEWARENGWGDARVNYRLHDWCISRQLWWGHRIPVWYCECGEQIVAREDPTSCSKCGSEALQQDPDVLDTWFSSQPWPF